MKTLKKYIIILAIISVCIFLPADDEVTTKFVVIKLFALLCACYLLIKNL